MSEQIVAPAPAPATAIGSASEAMPEDPGTTRVVPGSSGMASDADPMAVAGAGAGATICSLMNGSPLLRSRRAGEARDQRRPGQVGEEPLVVVGHTQELDEGFALCQPGRIDARVADGPVAGFWAPGAADVHEGGLADLPRVWQVRVPEEDRRVRVLTRHALHGGGRSILEQILVDATRAAVDGEDVAAGGLEHEVILEGAQVCPDLVAHGALSPLE